MAVAFEHGSGDWQNLVSQLKGGLDELQGKGLLNQAPFKGLNAIFTTPPQEDKQLFATQVQKNKPQAFSLPLTFRSNQENGAALLDQAPGCPAWRQTRQPLPALPPHRSGSDL